MIRNITRLLVYALFCTVPAAGAWADGAVYAMTNALGDNQILVYHRAASGKLTLMQTIATGGGGSGLQLASVDSLGSQGSLVLDPGHHLLFAVNTESTNENNGIGAYNSDCQQGTITSFLVAPDGGLTFAARVFSGGLFPDSVAVKKINNGDNDGYDRRDLVYVLNAGGPGVNAAGCSTNPNITGFIVNYLGDMSLLSGSRPIIDPGPSVGSGENCSAASAEGFSALTGAPAIDFQCGLNPPAFTRSPGEVLFTPDGNQLVVTVKGPNSIYVFPVDADGTAGAPMVTQAPGPALPTYFGFAFDPRGHMILSDTFGLETSITAAPGGTVSSFTITQAGALNEISADIGDAGIGACWVVLEPVTGRYVYVSNSLSNSLSSYSVSGNGSLTLLAANAAAANGPNDLAVAAEGGASFFYVLESYTGTVKAWSVNHANGSLTLLQTPVSGLPVNDGAEGLAAY